MGQRTDQGGARCRSDDDPCIQKIHGSSTRPPSAARRTTADIWFYQLDPGRSLGKTNPLNDDDLAEFVELQRTRPDGPKSWIVKRADLDEETFDLSVKNPNEPEAEALRSPEEIIADMLSRDAETAQILEDIRGML